MILLSPATVDNPQIAEHLDALDQQAQNAATLATVTRNFFLAWPDDVQISHFEVSKYGGAWTFDVSHWRLGGPYGVVVGLGDISLDTPTVHIEVFRSADGGTLATADIGVYSQDCVAAAATGRNIVNLLITALRFDNDN